MSFRHAAVGVVCLVAGSALAQIPDVSIKGDARLGWVNRPESSIIRWYDSFGRRSTLGLQFFLEPGLRAFASQRFERIKNDGDGDQIDEFYVEDVGNWRVGKQLLPFGTGLMFNERALAVRTDSFSLRTIPVIAAACDAGQGRQRGVTGRIGSKNLAVSFAVGEHFAISSSSLTVVRRPEEATGIDTGYRLALGAELGTSSKFWSAKAEYLALRRPNRSGDPDYSLLDLSLSLTPDKYRQVGVGITRDFASSVNNLRLTGRFLVVTNVWVEPVLRYRNGRFSEFGVFSNVRF